MTVERSDYQNIRVATEDDKGVRNDPSSFVPIAGWGANADGFDHESLEDQTARIDRGHNPVIVGSKAVGTFPFNFYAVGLQTPAGDGVPAAQRPEGIVLHAAVGEEVLGTGDLIDTVTPGTASEPIVDGTGAFADDTIAGYDLGGTTGVVWRHIETVTVLAKDVHNLSYELPAAPTGVTPEEVFACANYQLVNDLGLTPNNSMQVQFVTERAVRGVWEGYGIYASGLTIERLGPRELAVINVENNMTDWDNTQSATLSQVTLPSKSPWFDAQAELWLFSSSGPVAYDAANCRAIRSFQLSLDNNLIPDLDPCSVSGVADWLVGGAPAVEIEVMLRIDEEWRDNFNDRVDYAAIFTFGRTPGKTFIVFARQMTILEEPEIGEDDGLMTQMIRFGLVAGTASPSMIMAQG